jgi:hypothetical protein
MMMDQKPKTGYLSTSTWILNEMKKSFMMKKHDAARRIWVGGLNPKHKKSDIESEVFNETGAFKTYSLILERKYCYKMPTRDKVSSICIP